MQTQIPRISIFPVLLVNFIGTLGYSIILPFLVILVLKFGGNELIYGIMGATYSFFQFIGAPILGNWSDRYGRRKILLLSQAGTFLAWVLFIIALLVQKTKLMSVDTDVLGAFTLTVPLLLMFIARALDGLTGGNVSVANAYLADVTPEAQRKVNFGKMAAWANLGFIIGPAVAGILGGTILEEKLPVLMAILVSLIAIFVIAVLLPESKADSISEDIEGCKMKKVLGQEPKDCYKLAGADRVGFRQVLKLKNIPLMLSIYFLTFLAFNLFYVAFPIHAVLNHGWTLFKLGVFYSIIGLIMAVVEGPVLSRISDKFSDSRLCLIGSLLLAAGFLLFTASSEVLVFLGVLLFSGGNGLMWPSFLSILSRASDQKYQGAIQGYASSAGSMASIIGLVAGGLIYAQIGPATFGLSAVTALAVFAMSFRLRRIEDAARA